MPEPAIERRRHPFVSSVIIALAAAALAVMPSIGGLPAAGAAPIAVFQSAPWRRAVPIVPGTAWRTARPQATLESTAVHIHVRDEVAITTIDLTVRNTSSSVAEAVVLLPLPFETVVTSMQLEGDIASAGSATEGMAKLMHRDEARAIYERIVAQMLDPALLEFVGWNLVQTSVFPVPANGTQRVRIVLEHLLESAGGAAGAAQRLDLLIPRSDIDAGEAWSIVVDVESSRPIADCFSPTHAISTTEPSTDDGSIHRRRIAVTGAELALPGSFRLAILREWTGSDAAPDDEPLATSVILSPDPEGDGGHYMLIAAPRAARPNSDDEPAARPREVIFAVDRSGSMAGEKMRQAREAAAWLVDRLGPRDRVNIVPFSHRVESLFDAPRGVVAPTRDAAARFIAQVGATGGTNIHDALLTALRQGTGDDDAVRTIIFLTDGTPTVGRTAESEIRSLVERGNLHDRRIHVLGVGNDVNAPLLDRIATVTGGDMIAVRERDSILDAVTRLAVRLDGPSIDEIRLAADRLGAIVDTMPSTAAGGLPDLHPGERLIVVGRYLGETPFALELRGRRPRTDGAVEFRQSVLVDPARASGMNTFVGRLWAVRQIAELVDEVRQSGGQGSVNRDDPRVRELVESIVALSLRWGVLTEYTAFLATDGAPLGDPAEVVAACTDELMSLAVATRSGVGAVAQSANHWARTRDATQRQTKAYVDQSGVEVAVEGACQVAQESAFRRGERWYDGRALQNAATEHVVATRTVRAGAADYTQVVDRLLVQNRQGLLALGREVLIDLDGELVLVVNH